MPTNSSANDGAPRAGAHASVVAALGRELPDWEPAPAEGGWSLWITLPTGSAAAFAQVALRHGVAIAPGGASSPDEGFPDCVRICYGPAPPVLELAARRLANAWSEFATTTTPITTLAHP